MPKVLYGSKMIEYSILEKEGLKSHYITVAKDSGVVLKGKAVPPSTADRLIAKKAKWILDKLALVKAVPQDRIVTGSRLPYLGRSYYVQILIDKEADHASLSFNHSKFIIKVPNNNVGQKDLKSLVNQFYKEKALEKLAPRIEKLSKKTSLIYDRLQLRKMNKRWGSCTGKNTIILNIDAIKLPFSLIDYLIIHELVHTKVKDHSKKFWAELSKYMPKWRELDGKMKEMKM